MWRTPFSTRLATSRSSRARSPSTVTGERRSEIGLRRALGANRNHVRMQFLSEALLLSVIGGGVGVMAGALVTAAYSQSRSWAVVVPPVAVLGGVLGAVTVGGLAGLWPAMRAARLSPTEALRTA